MIETHNATANTPNGNNDRTVLSSESGFIKIKTVGNTVVAIWLASMATLGFIDASGMKISSESALAEGSELSIELAKIIPEPIPEFVTTLSTVNGTYAVTGYIDFELGPIHEQIWVPGSDRATEFRNDVPIRVIVKGEDLDAFKFIDGDLDLASGKTAVTAEVDISKLRFDAEILEGVQLEPGTPRPLIVNIDPTKTKVFDGISTDMLNKAILACEALPFSDEGCKKIDFLQLNDMINTLKAINNSDARIAALDATTDCHMNVWLEKIKPAIEQAVRQNVLKYRPMTDEEAKRLITVSFIGTTPDFTRSIIDDYISEGTLAASATNKFSIKEQNELGVTCSSTSTITQGNSTEGTPPTDTLTASATTVSFDTHTSTNGNNTLIRQG